LPKRQEGVHECYYGKKPPCGKREPRPLGVKRRNGRGRRAVQKKKPFQLNKKVRGGIRFNP